MDVRIALVRVHVLWHDWCLGGSWVFDVGVVVVVAVVMVMVVVMIVVVVVMVMDNIETSIDRRHVSMAMVVAVVVVADHCNNRVRCQPSSRAGMSSSRTIHCRSRIACGYPRLCISIDILSSRVAYTTNDIVSVANRLWIPSVVHID